MGMGLGGDIYLGTCFHAGALILSSRPVIAECLWREYLDSTFLLVSSNDALDGRAEWNDFFGLDRHGGTFHSCGMLER